MSYPTRIGLALAAGVACVSLVSGAPAREPVAFVISDGAVVIDFTGPWEVFQDVMDPARGPKREDQRVYQPYLVSDTMAPIRASGGMELVPNHTFDDAPTPAIVVIPAQEGRSPRMLAWIRRMAEQKEVVMSVCVGAFVLADAGLLDGKEAATHHLAAAHLQQLHPKIHVLANRRFVQSGSTLFTAGGLTAGVDLALHIVDLRLGRSVAEQTARFLEYEGQGWQGDGTAKVAEP